MERLPKEEVQLDLFDDQMADLRQWLETTGIWRRILDESHQPTDAPPAQLDASCPGIAYEFDVRPEQEARFNTVVSVLGPMIQHLHKINPLVVASQLISSRPLVWVERYPDDEAMKRNIGPLCSRDYCVRVGGVLPQDRAQGVPNRVVVHCGVGCYLPRWDYP